MTAPKRVYELRISTDKGIGEYGSDYYKLAIMEKDEDHHISQIRNTKKQEIIEGVWHQVHIGSTDKSYGKRLKDRLQKQVQRLNEEMGN